MRKIKTLKKNYEFQNVLTKGKFYIGKQITIYIAENKRQINQIGIDISKKTCNAVKRNHIKRKRGCYFQPLSFAVYLPQQCLYFFPEPQGQGSFLPIFFSFTIVPDFFCSL